jgi:hypothetical protein
MVYVKIVLLLKNQLYVIFGIIQNEWKFTCYYFDTLNTFNFDFIYLHCTCKCLLRSWVGLIQNPKTFQNDKNVFIK